MPSARSQRGPVLTRRPSPGRRRTAGDRAFGFEVRHERDVQFAVLRESQMAPDAVTEMPMSCALNSEIHPELVIKGQLVAAHRAQSPV